MILTLDSARLEFGKSKYNHQDVSKHKLEV